MIFNYEIAGPIDGEFLVGYRTPGTHGTLTVATVCRTAGGAQSEQDRLNREQERREMALIRERELCGVYFGAENYPVTG